MTEENIDQVIRCIKECWWRVGVLLAIVFGFALVVMHGWPRGDWGFGWGAIGALGTIITGGAALNIAYMQKKASDERVKNSEWIVIKSTLQEVNETRDYATEILLAVEKIADGGTSKKERVDLVNYSLDQVSRLKEIVIEVNAFSHLNQDLVYECYIISEKINEFKVELSEINLHFILEQDKGEVLVLRNIAIMLMEIMEGTERFYELAGFSGAKGSYAARLARALKGLMGQSGIQHPLPENLVMWDARLLDGW